MQALRFFIASVGHRTFRYPWLTPPIGILSLAAIARERCKARVRLVNQRLYNISNDTLVKEILDFNPHIVGLSAFTPNKHNLIDVCAKLKTANPQILILVGGPHAAAVDGEILKETCADIAVPSEGEIVLEQIFHQFQSDRDWGNIPGIFWRSRAGDIVENPKKIELIEDLDTLPFPAYDLDDLPAYWRLQFLPPGTYPSYITLMSSRGCPYGCKWCHSIFGKKFRAHSAQRVIEEIIFYNKTYGVRDFEFQDDIFNFDRARILEFCDLVHKNNLKLKLSFPNGLRTDILQEDEIDALVSAGTHLSAFALETGSPRLQKEMGKRLDIGRFLHNVEYAAKRGIFSAGYIMIGFPTETAEEMRMTIDITCSSALHFASFFNVTPFPKTEIYEMAMKTHREKILNYDYTAYDFTSSRFNISAEPDEVVWRLQREANRRFYSPKRIYRIIRDVPTRHQLFLYLPQFFTRLIKRRITQKASATSV